jgi:diacylglycerol kinase family enzyme
MSSESKADGAPAGPVAVDGRRRVAAILALVGLVVLVVILVVVLIRNWWLVLIVLASVALSAGAAVRVVVLDGRHRVRWAVVGIVGVLGLAAGLVAVAADDLAVSGALVVIGAAAVVLTIYARRGYVRPVAAPEVTGPRRDTGQRRSVLFLNPKSGGGKVGRFDLAAEARRRGVETVVLGPDDDLTALAEQAVVDGVEVLGMAGGDGSQADVAAVAVAHDLPFVCIPAGTRNHFALDLNLDREDPRLSLDAFVEGVERRVDYGLAGDRFFVNNVSMGLYPHVVTDASYRDGRLKAATSLIPALMRDDTPSIDVRFTSPDGVAYETAQVLLVSNNPYQGLGSLDGAGRRVSLTGGVLGVLVVAATDTDQLARATQQAALGRSVEKIDGFDQWTAPELRIESSSSQVLAGVDGEAIELPSPLVISIVPAGLRVIVPVGTADPPASLPSLLSIESIGGLVEIAGGVTPGPSGDDS